MLNYIWQKKGWSDFGWKSDAILKPLGQARKRQGYLLSNADHVGVEEQAVILTLETMNTAAIEGEHLNRDAVRSSVARRLRLPTAGLPPVDRHADGLVQILLDATENYAAPLSCDRIKAWHGALFPTGYSGMSKIEVGNWRDGCAPMQVVSGPIGNERVHYEAPPAHRLDGEMACFIHWWENPPEQMDGILRAAVAHFWFVSIHPFDDGNGRIARAIADMALAQDEMSGRRLYSMSAQIMEERSHYYRVLEATQKGDGDITDWLVWFLFCFDRAIGKSQGVVEKTVQIYKFWRRFSQSSLNDRQRKVINKLLEAGEFGFEGGLTNKKYVGMTKTSRETAKRDMAELVRRGILIQNPGAGRSVNYKLCFPPFENDR